MLMTIHTSSSVSSRHEEKVPVVSIVGMGGIGKTALAQLVFKDDSIENNFELRIWVCVSDNFDIYKILRNIVESITRSKYDDVANIEVLVGNVHQKLSGKRYLLVLDDMWNDNAEDWENLRSLLNVGARGSKILVTTRNSTIASIVGCIIPPYNLKQLPENECWCIIRNKAFSPGGASKTPNMAIIGKTLELVRCVNTQKTVKLMGSLKHLRHLHLLYSDVRVLPDSIVSLTNLHTLNLFACRLFEALPLKIGLLEHLRCIDISFTAIAGLPDSVTCISRLRTLKFANCKNLDALPRELGALTRLRCLDLDGTKIKVLPESCISKLSNLEIVKLGDKCEFPEEIRNWRKLRRLTHSREETCDAIMPRGIEMLTCLEEIKHYVVRKEEISVGTSNSSGIDELASLNSLQVLVIKNLSRVRGRIDAERAKLKDKRNIQHLELHWEDLSGCDVNYGNHGMVLEGLQPHPNLAEFGIWGFQGLKLPKWMDSSSNCLPNLVKLTLLECVSCEHLPTLGGLPFLRVLWIGVMKSVKHLGKEFYHQENEEESSVPEFTTPPTFFPSLTQLLLVGMKFLEDWVAPLPPCTSFPFLEVLEIVDCPVLTLLPDLRLWTSLRKLTIWQCEKLKESIPYDLKKSLTFLELLEIDFIQNEEQRGVQPPPKSITRRSSLS